MSIVASRPSIIHPPEMDQNGMNVGSIVTFNSNVQEVITADDPADKDSEDDSTDSSVQKQGAKFPFLIKKPDYTRLYIPDCLNVLTLISICLQKR